MNTQERCDARSLKIAAFEESHAARLDAQIFGLPFSRDESEVILIPVPWEVTVSFRPGTAKGPQAIQEASRQIDLFDPITSDAWKYGFAMEYPDPWIRKRGAQLRECAIECIHHQEHGRDMDNLLFLRSRKQVNDGGHYLNRRVEHKSMYHLRQDKIVGIIGGDHSAPLGLMKALAHYHDSYGILHIDAHFDHRDAYEGFEFSHASIMRNASHIPQIEKFVHVGIRDYCKEEADFVDKSPDRFMTFTDRDISFNESFGATWYQQCENIVASLPRNVYISFDIDGLDPALCPHTGTPVPGGLGFQHVCFLLEHLLKRHHRIIGFDLCEVAPAPNCEDLAADWDANVGARILYRLCSLAAVSVFGHWHD